MSRGFRQLRPLACLVVAVSLLGVPSGCQRSTTLDGPDYEWDWQAFLAPLGAFVLALARAPAGMYESFQQSGAFQGFDSAAGYEFWRMQYGY